MAEARHIGELVNEVIEGMKCDSEKKIIGWFSCGVTSAIACKLLLKKYENVEFYYTDTGSQDDDSIRFLHDCENWYGKKITILRNEKYSNHFDVIEKNRMINNNHYFPCTHELKKKVRYELEEKLGSWSGQVWGFSLEEKLRAKRMKEQYPDMNPVFPLIDVGLTKQNCVHILKRSGIEIPKMYKLGYKNNNCIGCVRGGMGYWNKIRVDFPVYFQKMAKLERVIGHSCLKEENEGKSKPLFLDELIPGRGNFNTEILPECGLFCELEFMYQ